MERLRDILRQEQSAAGQKQVYVIAAFGNSPHSDGPFLDWVRHQQLPAGDAVSVMINGGAAERIPGVIYVNQSATVQAVE